MAILKCKMCGGDLNLVEGASTAECEYCGSLQTIPNLDDEKKLIQFERAERLRKQCEFDKAAGIYETIIADFRQEAEAYWGLVLCKYGIEYVDDPATGKKIPTCHRSSFDSILDDSDFDQALENADAAAQKVYREEAKLFERIRKAILEVSSTEKPYDIFICYKETDPKGDRTLDSVLAQDLYSALTDKGYRVFFSRITLQGKLGEAYEPYIFAALNSAKVMLAVGTCYEYYNAVWVKNEWSRYLKICAADKSKHLIPCYKDLDPEDMPREFNHLQGADLGKMGAVQDILFNMEKYIPLKKETAPVMQTANSGVAPLLKRAFMFLEDGDWSSAEEYCEQVLNLDPECAQAYLGKLMVEMRVRKQEDLKNCEQPFNNRNNYQKTLRFADDQLKTALVGCTYTQAKNTMTSASTEKVYKEAAKLFESIPEYLDSAELAKTCYESAEVARKDAILKETKFSKKDTIANCEKAIKMFRSIPGWKDADEQVKACQAKIEELKKKAEEDRLERERREENARKEEKRIAKRNKRIAMIAIPSVCAVIAFSIVLTTLIIPNAKYNKAMTLMESGNYKEAYIAFGEIGTHKDSVAKRAELESILMAEAKKFYLAGETQEAILLLEECGINNDIVTAYKKIWAGDYKLAVDLGLTNIVLPNGITRIADRAFAGCTNLRSVTIPNSVTKIGEGAFSSCQGLSFITIPNSVTTISNNVFYDCTSLTSITIPDSVTTIGAYAFSCSSLTSITIPNSVTQIGESAFGNCRSLTSITIPNSVTQIGESAFGNCRSLTSVTIPNGVTRIEDLMFAHCSRLTSITIPNSVISIDSSAFYDCTSLTSVAIPDSVTSIGEEAFYCCSQLTSITIPNSVTSIGENAFSRCTNFTSAVFENPNGWATSGWGNGKINNLANPTTAATYLRDTYNNCDWTRS